MKDENFNLKNFRFLNFKTQLKEFANLKIKSKINQEKRVKCSYKSVNICKGNQAIFVYLDGESYDFIHTGC